MASATITKTTKTTKTTATKKAPVSKSSAVVTTVKDTEPKKARTFNRKMADDAIRTMLDSGGPLSMDSTAMVIDGHVVDFAVEAAYILTITPEDAKLILARNTKNRTPNVENVNKIVTDLLGDTFRFNGQAVIISGSGRLLDGQHRLLACVETGIPIKTVFVTGIQEEAQAVMDNGKTRKLQDVLKFEGETDVNNLAATIEGSQEWELGGRFNKSLAHGRVTIQTSMAFLAEHPELRTLCRESVVTASKIVGLTPKMVSMLTWGFDKLSVEDRKDFFSKLISGAGLSEGDPILALRNTLLKDANAKSKYDNTYKFALVCKAWNAYRDGRQIFVLKLVGGSKPEGFPEPI